MSEDTLRPSEGVVEEPAEVVPAPADDTPEEDADGVAGKRYSKATWAEIETHWQCGTMNAKQLIEKYGVSQGALTKHFARHKILQFSKMHVLKREAEIKIMGAAAAAIDPKAVEWETKKKGRIAETREHIYNLSRATYARALRIGKDIQDGVRKEAECANDIKMLRHMEAFIEKNLANRMNVLEAEKEIDESQMPTLIFRDLTEEEIQAKAESDGDDDELGLDAPADSTLTLDDEDSVVDEGGV
jgi:hypothetical protein